jgi:hypothetical protein
LLIKVCRGAKNKITKKQERLKRETPVDNMQVLVKFELQMHSLLKPYGQQKPSAYFYRQCIVGLSGHE